jgi:hypothetical protein
MKDILYENAARYHFLCLGRNNSNKKIILEYLQQCERLVEAVLARDKIKALQISNHAWETSLKMMVKELEIRESLVS